ncbi:MAG: hypothetical protein A4E45_00285 [Methanosaeta sp. PtaB.Bin039]|nr:MAG: hypothetical protein A4E45_00285 [Methanosaeta sp. PtaB.Bin039]OPY45484.1 MAG: hypothetical protein A4E47_00958 [Methanosaeta sp. PtaU1.Bin028]HOT07150.1 7-cyano-7-deazaguanine synthase [Methanotrichaceae archaeon]HQF16871.1 7-cyano-7-deazaguanine synthase [Methanotrichaceae archaeon]HQI91437.1 7-cyano-7-deazaguanine synthase [Methanotrichaceae archaeon]
MKITVLFSGGKDSSLTALLLEPFFDQIELVTFSFGQDGSWKVAKEAAAQIGHPHKTVIFDEEVLDRGLGLLMRDGYPNQALNYVHRWAVEKLAQQGGYVADGTRRDDRAPVMTNSAIRSLEDRYHVQYLRPLAGLGWKAIQEMAQQHLEYEVVPSSLYPASDFEVGMRYALATRYGQAQVDRIFPANHTHSRIIRRKLI